VLVLLQLALAASASQGALVVELSFAPSLASPVVPFQIGLSTLLMSSYWNFWLIPDRFGELFAQCISQSWRVINCGLGGEGL
jgi:hypothetical protein